MTDLALDSDKMMDIGSGDSVPGEVVRKLVAWSEREIDRLLEELDVALREAEAAERQVDRQPAAADLNAASGLYTGATTRPSPSEMLTQVLPATPAVPAPEDVHAAPTVRKSAAGTAPRTTVVRRDAPTPQITEPDLADTAGPDDAQPWPVGNDTARRRGRKTSWLGNHWMMLAGIAVTAVGLLLLLLG